jgi:hypothetical protein
MGGVDHPRFIFARVLAFEARLEALADPTFQLSEALPYTDVHVESAMERHIAETILEGLEVSPAPSPADIRERVQSARVALALRAGGAQALDHAAELEGLEPHEVLRIVQRQARASLYLDRMVAPMLEPSDPELRGIHQSGRTPFSKRQYEDVEPALRRWYVARRLREAVLNYYEGSRFRVQVSVVGVQVPAGRGAPSASPAGASPAEANSAKANSAETSGSAETSSPASSTR